MPVLRALCTFSRTDGFVSEVIAQFLLQGGDALDDVLSRGMPFRLGRLVCFRALAFNHIRNSLPDISIILEPHGLWDRPRARNSLVARLTTDALSMAAF